MNQFFLLPLVVIFLNVAFNQKCAVSSIIPEPSLTEINVVVIVITCTVSRGWREGRAIYCQGVKAWHCSTVNPDRWRSNTYPGSSCQPASVFLIHIFISVKTSRSRRNNCLNLPFAQPSNTLMADFGLDQSALQENPRKWLQRPTDSLILATIGNPNCTLIRLSFSGWWQTRSFYCQSV